MNASYKVFGTGIALLKSDALSLFPGCVHGPDAYMEGKRKFTKMKTLKQILFIFVLAVGLSGSVSAQKDDQKRPPPKEPAPKVNPRDEKPPPKNTPREGSKPKKPGMAYVMVVPKENFDIA